MSTSHSTYVPLPSDSGGRQADRAAVLSLVPIHVVTHESQLPIAFLHPSRKSRMVLGFDCEGVGLSQTGTLCLMQLAFQDAIYLVDVLRGGKKLMNACKPALESVYITKVIHAAKETALYFQFDIKLHNVVDTQLAYYLLEEQLGQKISANGISFVSLLADTRYCGISYVEKKEVHTLLREDPKFWMYRPMSELMVRAAADDVRFLPYIHHKMMAKLSDRSLWQLAVRGTLHCRCFCINDNEYADWPAIPSVPDCINMEGSNLEEEILSVVSVPPAKMGYIIGRKGSSIMSIKESCNAEIIIGGAEGPADKVFIIGPVKQVKKAEAMLRGKMMGNGYQTFAAGV